MILPIVLFKVFKAHFQSSTKFYCNFLLLLEYELVVLHIFFCICLEVSTDLMKIQTIFICALLAIHEELAKL